MNHHLFKPVFLIFILLLASCQKNADENSIVRQVKDDFSSPKSLFVDHVSSFTGGVISVASDIRLKLNKGVPDSLVGTTLNGIFKFSPTIEGSTLWGDNKTIVFKPAQKLINNQKYEATANLKKLIPGIDKKKENFQFVFQTLLQNYEVNMAGVKLYNANDLSKVKVEGELLTADIISLEDAKKMLAATQKGSSLNINWEAKDNNTAFKFSVENVARTKKENEVNFKIDGSPIEVDKKTALDVKIPAIDDYKVTSAQIIRGDENYISVLFSDPLAERQNLSGLVTLSNTSTSPRLVINVNELKIYPTQDVSSTVTLTINKGVKNTAGYTLKDDFRTQLRFTQSKPEVKLTSSDQKAILPNSSGLILPFEAVGLKAVDVTIIKIFEDNMHQYLQVNSLGGKSQLNRVGRPVARKVVPLNTSGVTDLNSWNRYTLNLEDILKTEPGAVYQIQIGFRKSYSTYFCANDDQIESIKEELEEWGEEEEASYWDSYESYYNPNYNWQERDNPCSESYYGGRRSVSKILLASDFGLIAKKRDDGNLSVFVTNLVSAKPISGVSIKVYDYQQQQVAEGTTDGEGKVKINPSLTPHLVVAKKGDQVGYLKVNDGSALSLSNFDVTGTKVQSGLKGFLYGERGVWRPADTVHLGFILQDIEGTLPDDHPVIVELFNPNDQLVARKISSEPVGNMYRFDFVTNTDAPTGNWKAVAKVGGASFEKRIRIETIKPNRLKINLAFDKEKFSANDSYVSGDLNVRWLTGAKAGNLKAEFELLLKPVKTTFKKYPNFSFDDQSKQFSSSREMVYEGKVNSEGYAKINLDLSNTSNAPGALNAMLFGKVYEEGGDFSINTTTIPYYPYKSFVGVKTPEGDKRGILLTDEDHAVRIATVDADGNPVSRNGVEVKLFKLNWKWWWDNSYEYLGNYVGRSYRSAIASGTLNTTNGEGSYKLRVNHPEWGRYYLQVKDPISGHTAGQVIYMDWPGWAGKGQRGELDGAAMLDFGVEKEEYKVGENITLSIPSTKGNRILVSLETGSEVLQTFWVDAEEKSTAVSFEATPDMSPNVYAHLTMIQPHGQTSNDLPIRLYGVQSIKVVDPETTLNPMVKSPKELRPGQQYSIDVSEQNGKPMAYTIAVVDEGLLDLTNFKTPEPWSNFYKREALGVKTWDIYDDVMGAFAGKIERLLAVGGDGEIQPKEEKEANRFKPVVEFLGPFYLDKGKTAKHTLKMPQYIGSVKTMIVASSDNAFGHTDTTTPVKQPLMVLATLPRVAGPNETMKLPVNLFALDDNINNVQVTVEATGALALEGKKTKPVSFNGSGDKVIYFDLKAKPVLGIGKVKVIAKSGSLEASYDVEMNVIPRNPMITNVSDKVLSSSDSWKYEYEPVGIIGKNTGTIEVSSLPPLNIEKRLGYLIRYPHGCIEQTTSSVFAQLFIDELVFLNEDRLAQIQRNVEAGIKRLTSFQLGSGGFSYWPGNAYPNHWGTNYAGHFLVEAKKEGYMVPEGMLAKWIGYQTQLSNSWSRSNSDNNNDLIQAYRLYTLALADAPAIGAMNRMKEAPNISRKAKWRLALAYAVAGYDVQATEMIQGLSASVDSLTTNYRQTFGSATRDKAMIMETLLSLKQETKAFELLRDIAEEMGDQNKWMSTQTTAYCFIAISRYAENFGSDKLTDVSISIAGNDKSIEGTDFVYQIPIDNGDKSSGIDITNNGEAPVFVKVIRTGIPLEGTDENISRNINLSVKYLDLDGNQVNISNLPQGTNFKAIISVTNPGLKGDYNEIALTQIFPSGWEIINTRLDGSGVQSKAEYIDIRDDRVMHYFDLKPNKQVTFEVLLNASYQGMYYLPAVSVGAMYDNTIFSSKSGRWVNVVSEN
ncbi:alpha-2-macroglobulin family protein [Ekhidna sp.]|uniref:alpha-2-macroglobulin family protein n=1 Tax=Ekhidna sp. TaxID=2608089 RepID=UPI003B513DD0